jgi:DNA polymerase III subunit gamma/tau
MASQALYRRYRSQTFGELVGQEHIVQTLRNALAEGRIAHAYLFTGPRGVGKTTVARLLAKAVNCLDVVENRPCGVCEMCTAIAEGRATDVIEMDAASHTSVEDAREIIERVQFRPSLARKKVYVIDECFRYEELVTLADGSKAPIGKIVEEQWQVDVLSYNEQTGQIEPKRIVRHLRKQPTLPMVRVTFNNNRTVICTLSHKFYTPQGMLRAGELEAGQFVYANFERMTQHQLNIVVGAAVGDGSIGLTDSKMRGRLGLTQRVAQKDYLDYKVQLLGDLAQTAPYYYNSDKTYSKTGTYHFSTVSRPQIAQLHHELYDANGRKRITTAYLDKITTLGLALWYLDDGSLTTAKNIYTRKDGSVTNYPATRSTLSVHGFLPEEAQLICRWLHDRWGVEARVTVTAKGPVIWLTLAGTDRLHQIISSHVPPSMEYKLLPQYRGQFCPTIDDMLINGLATSRVKRVERVPSPQFVYDIEVADNHNYFVRDILVSNCHMLSTAAFNALLKTLEEPPDHALFILATTEVHKVPATILSRCQRFVFNRHGVAQVAPHLREIAAQEGFELEPGVPEAIGRAATGSMRDALSILDQLMAYGGGRVTLEQVRGLLGATESQEVSALLDALLAGDVTAALRVVGQVAGQGVDLRQFARDIVERLRALMLLMAGANPELLEAGEDELETLRRQAAAGDLGTVVGWVRLFGELDHQLRTSPYGQLPLELAVVEALTAERGTRNAERRTQNLEPRTQNREQATGSPRGATPPPARSPAPAAARTTPAPPQQRPAVSVQPAPERSTEPVADAVSEAPLHHEPPAETAPVVEQPLPAEAVTNGAAVDDPFLAHLGAEGQAPAGDAEQPADLGEAIEAANADVVALEYIEGLWPAIVRDVRPRDKTLEALLKSGVKPIDFKDATLVLEVPSEWLQRKLETPQLKRIVEDVLSKHAGAVYAIRCVVEAQRRENPNVLREQIRSSRRDPLVKAAINIFDADIIGVEGEKEQPE